MTESTEKKSLSEVHQSVDTSGSAQGWRKIFAFLGPAYMISVGYMDPGNWATDIAGGSKFGYSLIWVLVMSNLIALLLQSHCARLGIVSGKDLAQASRETFSPFVNFFLYLLAEIAIAACDLAEVVGMAIGLQLLFKIPLVWGVIITVLDSFLLLFLLNFGIRKLEAFIIALVAIIGMAFGVEMLLAKPAVTEIAGGLIPGLANDEALYIAIGIIGATVMPHNLYLHSSLVQTRKFKREPNEIRKAIRYNIFDSTIALNLALFVNAGILILSAATFYKNGLFEISEIQDAHKFLEPMLGTTLAPILFAVALIAAGQSSTITGTLAGQIIMEGYLNLRIPPWVRRLLTRLLAIIPALLTILYMGESATGKLLILSQVILSLQLGFAVIPLIHHVSDKKTMGEFSIGLLAKIASWICALVIVGLNAKLVYEQITDWRINSGGHWAIDFIVIPLAIFSALMLLYIIFFPLFKQKANKNLKVHAEFSVPELQSQSNYKKIAVALDFSNSDSKALNKALQIGGNNCSYVLIHIVETPGAFLYGKEASDFETNEDRNNLNHLTDILIQKGYRTEGVLGYGNPSSKIPLLVNENNCELLVMGTHGHRGFLDFLLGNTVDKVRHDLTIPVLLV